MSATVATNSATQPYRWRLLRALFVAAFVSTLTGELLYAAQWLGDRRYYERTVTAVFALYPFMAVLLVGLPACLALRSRIHLPRWLLVPAAPIGMVLAPVAALAVVTGGSLAEVVEVIATDRFQMLLISAVPGGLAFWMLTETREPTVWRLRRALGLVLVICAAPVIWVAAWVVDQPQGFWDDASAGECEMMAVAVKGAKLSTPATSRTLLGRSAIGGPCDWPALGLPLARMTDTEHRIGWKSAGDESVPPPLFVSRPQYSLMRLRAGVLVSDGTGHRCDFTPGPSGWQLTGCRNDWRRWHKPGRP